MATPDNDEIRRDSATESRALPPRNRWRTVLAVGAAAVAVLAAYSQYRKAEPATGPSVPAPSMWIASAGRTQSGLFLEVTHPFTWRAIVASPTQPTVTYNATVVTPDSGSLSLILPDQSGLIVFGMDSVSAGTTADAFITRKLHALVRDALVNSPAQMLSESVYQAELRTTDGSPTGMLHVMFTPQPNASPMRSLILWRMFLGDVQGNALAIQIAIDSLHIRGS